MYFSEWKLSENKFYYETIGSFTEETTPFFKVRLIPIESATYYMIVVRDYESEEALATNTRFGMAKKNDEGVFLDFDKAKGYAISLALSYLRDSVKNVLEPK